MFFPGRMSPEKTDFSWFRRLRPAEVCDACPTGRVRWGGKAGGYLRGCPAGRVRWSGKTGGCLRGCPAGRVRWSGKTGGCLRGCPAGRVRWGGRAGGCLRGCPAGRVRWSGMAGGYLWGVPCRASPLGRKGRRIPMGCALPGESVGAEWPADTYGVCPAGRVCWVGKAGGCLWGVPCRASPLGRKGRRIPMGCALPGESVGLERPAEICDAFWVRCGNGFPAAGPCFRFGKNFFEVAAHLAGLIRYTG